MGPHGAFNGLYAGLAARVCATRLAAMKRTSSRRGVCRRLGYASAPPAARRAAEIRSRTNERRDKRSAAYVNRSVTAQQDRVGQR